MLLLAQAPIPSTSSSSSSWAASVRSVKANQKHRIWQPQLDPPPLLHDVVVVLVAPKLPVSIGTVARSLSCFECPSLRLVQPRCERLTRASRNSSKGAQYLLHNAETFDSIHEALADCHTSAAFARWTPPGIDCLQGIPSLLDVVQHATRGRDDADGTAPGGKRSLALVYGREEAGLLDDEVAACDYAVCIPIGRLQESLSLSHAVSITLSQLYQSRLDALVHSNAAVGSYTPLSTNELAVGWTPKGKER